MNHGAYTNFQLVQDEQLAPNGLFKTYDRNTPFKTPDGLAFTNGAVLVLVSDPDQIAQYKGRTQVAYGLNGYVNVFFKDALAEIKTGLTALPDFTGSANKPVVDIGDYLYGGAYLAMISNTLIDPEYHVCKGSPYTGVMYIKHHYGHACLAPVHHM